MRLGAAGIVGPRRENRASRADRGQPGSTPAGGQDDLRPPVLGLRANPQDPQVVKAVNHVYAAALTTDGQPHGTSKLRV